MAPKTKNNEPTQSGAEKPIAEMNLLEKINNIRKIWSETDMEKTGSGKAGGGAKYDYYKPQQVIDFCLKQELAHNLFSEFTTNKELGTCCYSVIDIPTSERRDASCPFDVPRKMAASEAQQVGAAITYFQRRLSMLLYKIEDNSKENVGVMSDADYSQPQEIPAPEIKAPPIAPPPAVVSPKEAEPVVEKALPPAAPVPTPAPQEVSASSQDAPAPAPVAQWNYPAAAVPLPDPVNVETNNIGSPLSTPATAPPVAPPAAPSAPTVTPAPPAVNPSKSIEGLYD